MNTTICKELYYSELSRRSLHPLRSGRYKLCKAQRTWLARMEGLGLIESSIQQEISIPSYYDLNGWTGEEWRHRLKQLPEKLARDLGYRIGPAIRAMCDDPDAPLELKGFREEAEKWVDSIVSDCDRHRGFIAKPSKRSKVTIERIGAAQNLVISVLFLIEDALFLDVQDVS